MPFLSPSPYLAVCFVFAFVILSSVSLSFCLCFARVSDSVFMFVSAFLAVSKFISIPLSAAVSTMQQKKTERD